jgi:hypothetical protein
VGYAAFCAESITVFTPFFLSRMLVYTLCSTWASNKRGTDASDNTSTPQQQHHRQHHQHQHRQGAGSKLKDSTHASSSPAAAAAAAAGVVRLQQQYAAMADAFRSQGLDLAAIADVAQWFDTGERHTAAAAAEVLVVEPSCGHHHHHHHHQQHTLFQQVPSAYRNNST